MGQGIVINMSPVAIDKRTDEQEQRALRLMEIGDESFNDFIFVAWGNDDLSA